MSTLRTDKIASLDAKASYDVKALATVDEAKVSLGVYAAGLVLTTYDQYFTRSGVKYRPLTTSSLPYTTTGVWGTEGVRFTASQADVLRQDLGATTGAAQVGFGAGTVDSAITALQTAVSTATNAIPPSGLRIAFHYHYEFDETKLERLKQMGFNTIWVYQSTAWMNDIPRSTAWLNLIRKHGLYAIFQAEWSLVNASNATHLAWIDSVNTHTALLGWTGVDEPAGVSFPVASQQTFASVMRAHTKKPLFLVEAAHQLAALDNFYRSDVCDVFLLDNYATTYTDEATFKMNHTRPILNLLSYGSHGDAGKLAPATILPVVSGFGTTGFPVPTQNQAKWAIEGWRPFVVNNSYGVFAHDVTDVSYTTLDNSEDLRTQALAMNSLWKQGSGHGYSLVVPVGYQTSPYFLEATNVTRTQYNTHFLLTSAATGDYSLGIKHEVAPGTKYVIIYAKVINGVDSLTRTINLEINDSGTWVVVSTQTFAGVTTSADIMFPYPVNANARSIGVRARVVNASAPAGAVGIMSVAAVNT